MTIQREKRVTLHDLEMRAQADGDTTVRTLVGYAAIFDSATDVCGYFTEVIAPGAFTRTLRDNDVVALYSHDMGRVLGRMSKGTLRCVEDDRGLKVEIDLPDTTDGRDVAVLVDRGDVRGMSFGFCTRKQEWDETVEPPRRTIQDVDLYEVTVTAFPQYDDTELALRSLQGARDERGRRDGRMSIAARRARQAQIERGIR